jgi:hypothetical protein
MPLVRCRYEAEGRKKPKIIPALEDVSVVAVECGGMHTAALSADGKVRNGSLLSLNETAASAHGHAESLVSTGC